MIDIERLFIIIAIRLFLYMTLWFIAARIRKRLDTVDAAWGLGFVVVAWSVVAQYYSERSFVIAILVSIWGVRLASHIWRRSKKRGEDPRYEDLSRKWRGNFWLRAYLSIFLLQGVLILVISLPVVLADNDPIAGLSWLTYVGGLVWLVGFVIEAAADRQLTQYLRIKDRPKVLQTGLWRYSRHPNYFGELTQWWGIGIIALQARDGWLGLLGPAVLSFLIVFVSGIPPIEKRRQKDLEYQAYQKRTSALIPLPQRQ